MGSTRFYSYVTRNNLPTAKLVNFISFKAHGVGNGLRIAWRGKGRNVDASGLAVGGAAVGKHLEGAGGVGHFLIEAANRGSVVRSIDDNAMGCLAGEHVLTFLNNVCIRGICIFPSKGDTVGGLAGYVHIGHRVARRFGLEVRYIGAGGHAFGAAVCKHLEGAVGVGMLRFESADDSGVVVDDNAGRGCSIKYVIALFDYVCTYVVSISPLNGDRVGGYVGGDNITHGIASRQGGKAGGVALGAYVVVYAAAVGLHPCNVVCLAVKTSEGVGDGGTADGYVVFIDINSNLAIVNVNFAVDNFPCSGAVVLGPAEIHGVSGNAFVIVGQAGGSVASRRSGEGLHTAFGACGGATVTFHLHVIGGFGIKVVELKAGGSGRILFDKSRSTGGNLDVVHIEAVARFMRGVVFGVFPF